MTQHAELPGHQVLAGLKDRLSRNELGEEGGKQKRGEREEKVLVQGLEGQRRLPCCKGSSWRQCALRSCCCHRNQSTDTTRCVPSLHHSRPTSRLMTTISSTVADTSRDATSVHPSDYAALQALPVRLSRTGCCLVNYQA